MRPLRNINLEARMGLQANPNGDYKLRRNRKQIIQRPTPGRFFWTILQPLKIHRMRLIKWTSVLAALLLVAACFMDWIVVESRGIVISGVDSGNTGFGKPGFFHIFFTAFFLVFSFIPRIWAKRWNLAVVALNIGWALRNYFLIAICRGGECPTVKPGMWLVLVCSVLMLLGSFFPDIRMDPPSRDKSGS